MERKIKMQKDKVIKDIPENLVSEYSFMGWSKVKEEAKSKEVKVEAPNFEKKVFKKD